ncbi:hypothetical protein AEAC466_18465 [Asticcacaulis sp. AC466]|uniref:DUF885 domain-containing protein n=1 Tax=Asticcacaulis sp. AC466 TaxID=1282362 RepID=UPI0003C3F9AD|nr:DUF885 family protein [Asticcacaulis sp. AC466]ESQ82122.1 hypothetical protein AEAC466_18465 [Asticcacaulis sp. AC466]
MIDRRFLVGALGALLGLSATDALAARKKKVAAKSSGKKSTKATKKGKATSKKGRKGKPEPKRAPPKPVEPAPPPAPDVTPPELAAALKSAFDAILRDMLMASPALATSAGLDTGEYAVLKSRLDDRSDAAKSANITRLKRSVDRLNAINRNDLAAVDRVNYDTVLWDMTNQLALARNFSFGDNGLFSGGFPNPYVISQLSGAWQFIPDFLDSQHTIEKAADAQAYLARLSAFAVALDQETVRVKADFARGVVPPDFILTKTIKALTALRDTDPAASGLINSLVTRTAAKAIAGDWQAQATAIVTGPLKDALGRQIDALTAQQAVARHDAGVLNLSNGDAYYAQCVKLNTSSGLTPKDIHRLGLQKVTEITAELESRFRTMGRTQGTVADRMKAMYKDPQYLYSNDDAGKAKLLDDLNARVRAVQARLPQWFGVLPRTQVQIKRVPVSIEAGAPGGYYSPGSIDGSRPGMYYINLRDISELPSWTLPTLTYHESIPGHHLQGTIQQETQGLPMLRKLSSFNAYVEGWALYAEQLAGEMGLYDSDPAGRIGYLHDALFRAVRLVVDTGMHDMGWSREQAITYMVDTAGKAPGEAAAEIERYCVWPGQALGYMVGKLEWLKLRDAARAKPGFDIKRFHDIGLLCGAVPLDVLDDVYKAAGLI